MLASTDGTGRIVIPGNFFRTIRINRMLPRADPGKLQRLHGRLRFLISVKKIAGVDLRPRENQIAI
jgi:hypothetical protein